MGLDRIDTVANANKGTEITIVGPDGEPAGIYVTVLGRDSDEYQKRIDKAQKQRLDRMFKGGTFRAGAITTPAEDRAQQIATLAAITVSWREVAGEASKPAISFRGKEYECNAENAAHLYTEIPMLREQVQQGVDARENFYGWCIDCLKDFATHQFELSRPVDGGGTQREHLEAHYKQTGVMPQALMPVECPAAVLYLWRYFNSLAARRTSSGYAPNPVTHVDLESWARIRGIQLSAFELDALEAIDGVFMGEISSRLKEQSQRSRKT